MRVAVVGHVEWIRFGRVDRMPAPGENTPSSAGGAQAGGGGGGDPIDPALLDS